MCMPLSPVQGTWNCSQASQISNQLQQSCLPPKNGKRKERHQFHVPQVKSVHGRCSKAKLWWCCGTCLPHQQQDSWRLWHVGIVSGSSLIRQRSPNSTYSTAWTWSLLLLCDPPYDYIWGQPPYFFLPAHGSSPTQVASWPDTGLSANMVPINLWFIILSSSKIII